MTTSNITVGYEEGRVQTLTPDQEQKLKDMWSQVLIYCKAFPPSLFQNPSALTDHADKPSANDNTPQSPAAQPKAKRGWFGRKADPAPVATNGSKASDSTSSVSAEQAAFKAAVNGIPGDKILTAASHMFRADNPDSLLLRFLRARKWNVADALTMMGNTFTWRVTEGKPEELLQKGEIGFFEEKNSDFINQMKSGKARVQGYDLCGRPIIYCNPHFHDPKAQDIRAVQDFTVFLIENSRLCLKDPVDSACIFFDLSNFSLSNMDYSAAKFIIQCFESHYPESLGCSIIYKAPWVFSGIWTILKGWMDPVVAKKVIFAKSYDDLAKYLPDYMIPKEAGGALDSAKFAYVEPPVGESAKSRDVETRNKYLAQQHIYFQEFIDATIEWIKAGTKQENELAGAKKLEIAKKLENLYWEMDEYVRARSIVDRLGIFDSFDKMHSEWNVVPPN